MTFLRHAVVVVDDNARFVHHVFRHLTQAFEYGFESSESARVSFAPRASPDGVITVEWHDPSAKTADEATELLERFEARLGVLRADHAVVWALVDVYRVGLPDAQQWRQYARAFLRGEREHRRLLVVSSYSRHEDPIETDDGAQVPVTVYAKSPETLWELRKKIRVQTQAMPNQPAPAVETKAMHVLVTGAGFELAERDAQGRAIGIPGTGALLVERGEPLASAGRYPVPRALKEDAGLSDVAGKRNLDDYWEYRLLAVRRRITGDPNPPPELRARQKAAEIEERDAFRAALAEHDDGHLAQALWAAQLDWTAWLSTNYTRFTDRAIAFVTRSAPSALRNWRLITSKLECEALPSRLAEASPEAARWAIKLHGDIGQAQSMALAASDKEGSSNFAVQPNLAVMYALAEKLLIERLEAVGPESTCYWHVVGHGLYDRWLSELIRKTQGRTSRNRHVVTVVAPDAQSVVDLAIEDGRLARDGRCLVEPFAMTASSYLARLRRYGLPADDGAYRALLGART